MHDPEPDGPDVRIVTHQNPPRTGPWATRTSPSLSIAHLLLWTGCCALFVALTRNLTARQPGSLGGILLMLLALGNGTAATGLSITLTRSFRGAPWPVEPGQWLLAALGAVAIVEMLVEGASGTWVQHPQRIVEAVAACAFAIPLFSKRLASSWKWLFAAISVLHAFPLLVAVSDAPHVLAQTLVYLTSSRLAAATAIGAVALAVSERTYPAATADRAAIKRCWLHWAGLMTAVWLAALSLFAPSLLAAFV